MSVHTALHRIHAFRLAALLLIILLVPSLAGCAAAPQDGVASVTPTVPLVDSSSGSLPTGPFAEDSLWAQEFLPESGPTACPPGSPPPSASASSSASSSSPEGIAPIQPPAAPAHTAVWETSRWYYDRLDAAGQQMYLEIYDCLLHFGTELTLPIHSEALLKELYTAVLYDHPELFWVAPGTPYSYRLYDDRMDFLPNYGMTQQEAADYQSSVDAQRDRILAAMAAALPADADQFTRAQYLYEQLVYDTTYVLDSLHDQNIVSCLVLHETVCAGYARSYQYLMNAAGITCTYLSGDSRNERHAWNLAQLDGEWAYIDVTWGDSDTIGESWAGANPEIVYYTYFAVTLQQFMLDHEPDLPAAELPDATGIANRYFIRSGTLMESLDYDKMAAAVARAANQGLPGVSFHFVDMSGYNAAIQAIKNDEFFGMLKIADTSAPQLNENSYSYSNHEDYPVLTLLLQYE